MEIRKENKTIVTGKVKAIEPKSNDCVIVKVSHIEWDKTKKQNVTVITEIPFWNNSRVQWADILNKFNVKEGSPVGVKYNTTEDGKLFGSDFCFYSGKLVVNSEFNGKKQETNVIIGRVGVIKELSTIKTPNGDKIVKAISIAESKRENGADITVWHNVSFWDSEKNDFATRADKVIKKGDLIAVVCGECKQNGEYLNYTGFNFDILGRPKKKSEKAQSESGNETTAETTTDAIPDYSIDYDEDEDEDYPF